MEISATGLPAVDSWQQEALSGFDVAFVVTDPVLPDNPIRYASTAFCRLTGYAVEEVLHRNCRFLQGPETERQKVMEIRDAIREERACKVCLLNYKKSGEKFWNQLYIDSFTGSNGSQRYCIGIAVDVSNLVHCSGLTHSVILSEQEEASALQKALSQGLSSEASLCTSYVPSSLMTALSAIQQSFVLVDAQLPDMPIVYAGETFILMTGYPRDEIIGRNCRFLQGYDTDRTEIAKLRAAMTAKPPYSVSTTILNYRKDGTPFWNALHIAPIRNSTGSVTYFIGVQLDVSRKQQVEDSVGLPECDIPGSKMPLKLKLAHSGAVGKVKVAVRSLGGEDRGLRRECTSCDIPERGTVDYS